MALFDLPLPELERYLPELDEPADLDEFWAATLAETRAFDLDVRRAPHDSPLTLVDVEDLTFAGFGGHPIKAWVTRPAGSATDGSSLPAVVEFLGYGGGRGRPLERLAWAAAGYVHLLMDTRGQGSHWGSGGDTADPAPGSGPQVSGFLTRGILDPAEHFYRRVFTDGVRAVEAVRALPGVDPARVAVTGGSQGGGMTLAVAGLVPDLAAVMPDVPFLCHVPRAIAITDAEPYHEVVRYLSVNRERKAAVMRTLSYLDGVHLARRATAPTLFSVALRDPICPPSTVFAAYNHYGALADQRPDRAIEVYEFNEHEGGGGFQLDAQLRWLAGVLAR
ncbi:Acetyl xylan esterase [Cellulomonas flavigena DSM 20109]|uniref:Acetyl xylan esterase n=1 Tax=Cellulomonas flavigena (strain ATCC 482 / DSM 20109 / BCRC 11376 / JCM 18109 / NBRC 3775 / NCIMB 8073 / NRS 134) TaxID=446466 RepID=D5UKL6_CELFN|nr:acetylxylan esterase [Cellulomonas flavigena]ADG73834.1 Acetyl xylan esterase [Cellulomonas flavigena DSM 20109]